MKLFLSEYNLWRTHQLFRFFSVTCIQNNGGENIWISFNRKFLEKSWQMTHLSPSIKIRHAEFKTWVREADDVFCSHNCSTRSCSSLSADLDRETRINCPWRLTYSPWFVCTQNCFQNRIFMWPCENLGDTCNYCCNWKLIAFIWKAWYPF